MKDIIKIMLSIIVLFISLFAKAQNEFEIKGNPIITHKLTADPATLVHNDKLYLYASEDPYDPNARIPNPQNWLVFSTTDMVTWIEYPIPLMKEAFKWALPQDNAWASHVVERNGKFYWYASIGGFFNREKSIGVAVSDSPTGPFVDAIGKPLITSSTLDAPSRWGDVDPSVIIDDDGQAYIFWGGGQCCYAKLKENMTEIDGEARTIDLPGFFAGAWVHYYKGKYYLSFGQGNLTTIGYAMSKSLDGPWDYIGQIGSPAKNCVTYQHAITEFKGEWYFFYHNGAIPFVGGNFRRAVCIDRLYYNEDGTIQKVQMTDNGILSTKEDAQKAINENRRSI
ncbi:MAG: family 43 glycosylhydrolase [Prevotella sp.]|jgi:beta-xylosidase|nr:family 43 glycosylhydrolase [Prevotella sp.]